MSIALDIGTRHLRSLRREAGRLVGRKNHAVYLQLPDKPGQRRILEKASIRFATCQGSLLVIGQAALETADMLDVPCIPLLKDSHLPQADPVARQVLTSLIDCLLPPSRHTGANCWMSIPGAIDEDSEERRFFTQVIRLKGYVPQIVPPGMAIVLAELGQQGFSGLGCDFGSGSTRISLAHHGQELFSTCTLRGSDWIDARLAESEGCILFDSEGHRYLNTTSITRWKRVNLISVHKPISERERRLSLLCEELIDEVLRAIRGQLAGNRTIRTLHDAQPMVCAGGLAGVPGFRELLFGMIRDAKLPVAISEVRRCSEMDYAVTRGCLILAELADAPPSSQVA
jgi:hypothetical protein